VLVAISGYPEDECNSRDKIVADIRKLGGEVLDTSEKVA
jgi:hypothetical protein